MKQPLYLIIAVTALLSLAACRSGKNAAVTEPTVAEETKWSNVSAPCRLEVTSPMNLSVKGTLTMVRGKSMLVSARFLGFEVGQLSATPESIDLVMKQPDKIWINEDLAKRLHQAGLTFDTVQEAVLGQPKALEKVERKFPITDNGSRTSPSFTVMMDRNGQRIAATLTVDLEQAQWDTPSPATFTAPGSNYRRVKASDIIK